MTVRFAIASGTEIYTLVGHPALTEVALFDVRPDLLQVAEDVIYREYCVNFHSG